MNPAAILRRPRRLHRQQQHRVLLLTSGLGTGHSRAAAAIEQALEVQAPGTLTRTVDLWSMLDDSVVASIQQSYLRVVTEYPDLYQRLYQLDQHSWRNILDHGLPLPALLRELHGLIEPLAEAHASGSERHWLDRLLYRQLLAMLAGSGPADARLREFWQQATIHRIWRLLTKRLQHQVERFAPDVIVATQVTMAALAANVKTRRRLAVPLIGVITDYGVHDFWQQEQINLYCVADESMTPRLSRHTRDQSRIAVTGIPLLPEFANLPSSQEARQKLNLDVNRPLILILGGGLGLGIDAVVRALADHLPHHATAPTLIILAGRNQNVGRDVMDWPETRDAFSRGRIQVHGWTDHVSTYIRAADVVIGKPGGLTTAEVLACGRPLFSTSSLRGQESFNVAYLENNGVGQLLAEEHLVHRIPDLLDDKLTLQRMQSRAWALGKRNGAQLIAARVLKLVLHQSYRDASEQSG